MAKNIFDNNKKDYFKNPKKILIVDLYTYGDFVLSIPFFKTIRENYPKAKLILVCRNVLIPIIQELKIFDELIPNKSVKNPKLLFDLFKIKPDIAIAHNPLWVEQFYCFISRAKIRIGYSEGWIKELEKIPFHNIFLNKKIKPTKKLLFAIERKLEIAKNLGLKMNTGFKLKIPENTEKKINKLLKKSNLTQNNYVVICADAPDVNKCWNEENFSKIADYIIKEKKLKIAFVGLNTNIYENIIKKMNYPNDAKPFLKLNLVETFQIIKNSKFVISLETGTAHAAIGLNKKTIVLFGSGYPTVWAHKNNKNYYLIQKFNEEKIESIYRNETGMSNIFVKDVIEKIEKILE